MLCMIKTHPIHKNNNQIVKSYPIKLLFYITKNKKVHRNKSDTLISLDRKNNLYKKEIKENNFKSIIDCTTQKDVKV